MKYYRMAQLEAMKHTVPSAEKLLNPISKGMEKENAKSMVKRGKFGWLVANHKGMVRKLTPLECERLQTLPDNYTAGVSDSQRYKMIGNGWNVETVAHIFRYINQK